MRIRTWLLDALLRLGPCCGDLDCTICGPTVARIEKRRRRLLLSNAPRKEA